jgi:predicted porin
MNGRSATVVQSSGHGPSQLGFRGVEDLGGGTAAGFWLEAALMNDTGSGSVAGGGLIFSRRSTVGVSTPYGEIRAGRENTPTSWNHIAFDPFGGLGPGSAPNVTAGGGGNGAASANPLTFGYVSNALTYLYGYAPNGSAYIGRGVYFHLTHSFAENASGTPSVGRYTGGRLGYNSGPLNVAVAYSTSEGPPGYGSAAPLEHKELNAGAWYDFGAVRLMGRIGTNDTNIANTKFTHVGIGAHIKAGSGYIPLSFNKAKRDDAVGTGAQQFAVGYVYPLSRRTEVYTTFAHLKNTGGDTFLFRGGNGGGNPGLAGGGSGTGYDIGVTHRF